VATITAEEWGEPSPESFDTITLLRAVDSVDELRCATLNRTPARRPSWPRGTTALPASIGLKNWPKQARP
jgi:hypothetical protein